MTIYLDRAVNPDHTPLAWLASALATADRFDAVVGYLERAGVQLVEAPLRDMLERGGQAHIVVDYRDGRPRLADLRWLLDLFAPHGDRATVRLAADVAVLHAKVFAVRGAGVRSALVGSANFTAAGLSRNWEACTALEPGDVGALDAVEAALAVWRDHPAVKPVDLGMLSALADLTQPNPAGASHSFGELLPDLLQRTEDAGTGTSTGLSTGIWDLDKLLGGGLHPGQLVVVAGRTSMGKSTLAGDFLRSASVRNGVPSLLLSFEMTRVEVMQRVMSAEARIPLAVLRAGGLSDDDWTKLARRLGEVNETPLFINDTCSTSIRYVAEETRRAVREQGVRLVVVDFVQQLQADRRVDNRAQEITEIARALKRLALELGVVIVAVSQLNRGPEQRVDKRPVLSDLKESGSLEEAADVVILIHREDYYDKVSDRAGEGDLIVAKHRNGPTDTVTVAAQLHLSRFVNMVM